MFLDFILNPLISLCADTFLGKMLCGHVGVSSSGRYLRGYRVIRNFHRSSFDATAIKVLQLSYTVLRVVTPCRFRCVCACHVSGGLE